VFAVVLGLCALAVGPVLGPVLRRHLAAAAAVDGFVVVTVTGLVVLHVLPQSVAIGGVGVLPLAGLGVVVPALLHRFDAVQRPAAWRGGRTAVATALLLLAAFGHALLDGVALIDGHGAHGVDLDEGTGDHAGDGLSALAVAVLLHRLPYGLALWVVGRERLGLPRTLAVLCSLAAGTIVGALLGDRLVSPATAVALALVQAFAAGAILHVLLEAPAVDVSGSRRASSVGALLGIGVLVLLTRTHPVIAVVTGELAFSSTLKALAGVSAPVILAGLVAVVLLAALDQVWRPRVATGAPRFAQALSGVVMAAASALCACRVGTAFAALLGRRAGVAGATALLVAAPHVEVMQVLLSVALVGPRLGAIRAVGAVVVAVAAAVSVAALARSAGDGHASTIKDDGSATVEVGSGLPARSVRAQLVGAVEHVFPWLLVGVVAAAFLEPLLPDGALAAPSGLVGVVGAVALGGPLYLCAPAALPVAAVFLHKGASAGAVVAFLLSAPAMNVTTLGLLSRSLSRRAAAVFGAVVVAGAVAVGVVVDAIEGTGAATSWARLPLHAIATDALTPTQVVSVVVVVALVGWSLARQGARGFLGQIVGPLDDAKGGHVHGPHCGHREHARAGFRRRAPVARVTVDFAVADNTRPQTPAS
jgi:uncharacterized membrane protein YraQ (UPF0718 family)